ncbi:MAG: TetR/AcrR family transcriptional regulator [Erysipelotrichaceae bacterium]
MNKKQLIIDEAIGLFATKGYYGVGLSELLKKCHVPKGSFYHYFPNGKIQLIQETLQSAYIYMENHIRKEFFVDDISSYVGFERMIDHLSLEVGIQKNFVSLLMTMISIESRYMDEGVNKTCAELYTKWQELYTDYLRKYDYTEQECIEKSHIAFTMIHCSLITSWIKNDAEDLQKTKIILKNLLEK